MLYSLKGTLCFHDTGGIAVECGGVAYYCQTTLNTLAKLGGVGSEVLVYTYLSVRQDNLDLFAFADKGELSCFRMLIGVSGVGPKAALSILSVLSPERFALAVASGDDKALTAAQGVGKKLAQRIALELRDKVSGESIAGGFSDQTSANLAALDTGNAGEAISALVVLGYGQSEAAAVVSKMDPETPVQDMIRAGLKKLAGRA